MASKQPGQHPDLERAADEAHRIIHERYEHAIAALNARGSTPGATTATGGESDTDSPQVR